MEAGVRETLQVKQCSPHCGGAFHYMLVVKLISSVCAGTVLDWRRHIQDNISILHLLLDAHGPFVGGYEGEP